VTGSAPDPIAMPAPAPGPIAAFAVNGQGPCARLTDGRVVCWSVDGSIEHYAVAEARILSGMNDAREIVAGDRHYCVRRASGAVACWGDSTLLGDGEPSIVGPIAIADLDPA